MEQPDFVLVSEVGWNYGGTVVIIRKIIVSFEIKSYV